MAQLQLWMTSSTGKTIGQPIVATSEGATLGGCKSLGSKSLGADMLKLIALRKEIISLLES